MRTQVAIIGAGPAGLLLAHRLRQERIDVRIVEAKSQSHVLSRIRAGVLETTTTGLMKQLKLDRRLKREGMHHSGLTIVTEDATIGIELEAYLGRGVTVYGQTEITKDLILAAPERGIDIFWEADDVAVHDIQSDRPWVSFVHEGHRQQLDCDYVAGCDGFHGISRKAAEAAVPSQSFERVYPFGWLGILADVPPCHDEVVYAAHPRGFALASMRSPTRSRYYVQVPSDEPIADWPDDRLWDELAVRLGPQFGPRIARGPAIEKSIAPLRSFVFEPMRAGRLVLAGDAAHIVPPTGAKGLNLAASDVIYLADALTAAIVNGSDSGIDDYSARALDRIWKTERFSWYLTSLLHQFPDATPFEQRMQQAERRYIAESEAMRRSIAENYVGLPL